MFNKYQGLQKIELKTKYFNTKLVLAILTLILIILIGVWFWNRPQTINLTLNDNNYLTRQPINLKNQLLENLKKINPTKACDVIPNNLVNQKLGKEFKIVSNQDPVIQELNFKSSCEYLYEDDQKNSTIIKIDSLTFVDAKTNDETFAKIKNTLISKYPDLDPNNNKIIISSQIEGANTVNLYYKKDNLYYSIYSASFNYNLGDLKKYILTLVD
jgi:hypothetical protein